MRAMKKQEQRKEITGLESFWKRGSLKACLPEKPWKIQRDNCYAEGRRNGNFSYFCRSTLNGFAGRLPPTVCYG